MEHRSDGPGRVELPCSGRRVAEERRSADVEVVAEEGERSLGEERKVRRVDLQLLQVLDGSRLVPAGSEWVARDHRRVEVGVGGRVGLRDA